MEKCRDCFTQKIPLPLLASNTAAQDHEIVTIALAQSADSVVVWAGDSLCEEHLLKRMTSR